ncbi:MAG: hypothetical protein IT488_10900 [Gammaproteobacteria bacterium]|nr:hypothetical protein [Gammaproteobacteria bacterium]
MNNMKSILVAIATITLYACSNPVKPGDASVNGMTTSAYEVTLPDGTNVWHVECPGWANSWSNCFARADYICSSGFVLVEQRTNEGGASVTVTKDFAAGGQRTERIAIVKCK